MIVMDFWAGVAVTRVASSGPISSVRSLSSSPGGTSVMSCGASGMLTSSPSTAGSQRKELLDIEEQGGSFPSFLPPSPLQVAGVLLLLLTLLLLLLLLLLLIDVDSGSEATVDVTREASPCTATGSDIIDHCPLHSS